MTKKATEILNAIKAADSILICGHIRPDGDCVGSALAMYGICKKLGKNVEVACADGVSPATYAFLPNFDKLNALKIDKYDLFIAVDCANESRLGDMFKHVSTAKYSIKIDHHPSENNYCKLNYVDSSACSTCAIIFELFEDSGLIDCDIAKALYTGLSTDTGHFMHANTTPEVFGIAKKLSEYGFDVGAVNHDIYCSKTFNRIKLTARALESIQLHYDGKISLMVITQDDLKSCDCKTEDTEGLIDYAKSIAGVRVAISMCEQPGSVYRISLRAVTADVSAAAAKFGGGGHKLAAGCIISGNRYDVMEKVIAAATAAINSERAD